jgi:uncharacterized membrane protein YidH (DUF202 family)
MRLFRASLRKLVRRPATYITFGLLVGLLALILIAVGATARQQPGQAGEEALLLVTFPGAYNLIASFVLGLGGLFAMTYSAAIAGSEWSWGTLKSAVARGEGRSRYQLISFAAIALLVGIGLLLAIAFGVVAGVVAALLAGVSLDGLGDTKTLGGLPELLARGWLGVVESAALGFAIATLARSQLAGVGAGIAVYFGESFAAIFLPDIVKYGPFTAAGGAVATTNGGGVQEGGFARLDPNTAVIVVVAWLIAALVVTALFTERAEISG